MTRSGVAGIELGGIGVLEAADVARELDHHGLHAQADAEVGDLALRARSGWRCSMPSMPRLPKPPGTRMPSNFSSFGMHGGPLRDCSASIQVMLTLGVVRQPAVQQRFLQALVGILVLDVLADQADRHLARWGASAARPFRVQRVRSRGPASSCSRRSTISSTPCSANTSGHFVDAVDVARGDDGLHDRRRRTARSSPSCPAEAGARCGTAECRAEYRWRAVP